MDCRKKRKIEETEIENENTNGAVQIRADDAFKIEENENENESENGVLKIRAEDARKIMESFSREQLLDILEMAATKHLDVLEQLRSIAEKDPSLRKLFVRSLGWHTNTESLKSLFSQFGELEEAVVIMDRKTGKSKGYGFVTFKHMDGAFNALREPTKTIDGRMTVSQLASQRPIPPKPKIVYNVGTQNQNHNHVGHTVFDAFHQAGSGNGAPVAWNARMGYGGFVDARLSPSDSGNQGVGELGCIPSGSFNDGHPTWNSQSGEVQTSAGMGLSYGNGNGYGGSSGPYGPQIPIGVGGYSNGGGGGVHGGIGEGCWYGVPQNAGSQYGVASYQSQDNGQHVHQQQSSGPPPPSPAPSYKAI